MDYAYGFSASMPLALNIISIALFVLVAAVLLSYTQRRQSEKVLRESNENFHQLADHITDAFWIRSPDAARLHYISPAFEQIWGRSTESLYANPQQWTDFILPEDRERATTAFAGLTKESPSLDIEYRIVRPGGEIRWVRVRGFQVRDRAHNLIRLTGIVTDITERHLAAEELRESERRFSDMLRNLELVSVMLDRDARITYCNDYLLRTTGWQRDEVIGGDWFKMFLPPEVVDEVRGVHSALLADRPVAWHHQNEIVTRSGVRRLIQWNNSLLRSPAGEVIGSASVGEDITDRKSLEVRLLESQRLETVGKLAGGVAHEFNNMLTSIIGQSELLLSDLSPASPFCKNANEILKAADRAATLTKQLLAYGQNQLLRPEVLELDSVLAGMESSLRHLMGRHVELHIDSDAGFNAVKADSGQIEQVIMNIVMNAADAMPNGGKLFMKTARVTLDAGDYVMLAITDTGVGITEEVKAHLFEPFVTTKGVGQGTGLGLSACYGIIKQSGGHITVDSELGRGTTVKVYLPAVDQEKQVPARFLAPSDLPRGTETVLLVEDDPSLRAMMETLLIRLGYTVLAAVNAIGHIDLLITNAVMPRANGNELSELERALSPDTRILLTSAYTEKAILHSDASNKGMAHLQKPFTPSGLAHKLRTVLDV
jgi:PAS domain S-box-containing protein